MPDRRPPAAVAVVALLLIASAAARGAAGEPTPASGDGTPVPLRLEAPPSGVRGPGAAAERAVLQAFLDEHPHVRVEPHTKLRMAGPRGEATLYMAMAAQTAPDALLVYARSMQKYIEQDFLYPLDEYITDELRADPMFQKLLPAISRDGHVYGLPAHVAVHALLYRKDLFADAGLDPDQPPRTWDELLDYSRRLTFPEKSQFGMLLEGGGLAGWRFCNYVWQAGGDVVRQQPDGSWRLTLDEPPAVAALTLLRELRWGSWQRDGVTLTGAARVDSAGLGGAYFRDGRAAMMVVSTTEDVGRYVTDPTVVGLAPLPAGPAGDATMIEAEFWGISNLLRDDPARRAAAWQYIRFLTSERARRVRARVYVESGWPQNVAPRDLERFGYHDELARLPRAWLTLYDNLARDGRLEPYAPNYDQVSTDVLADLDRVLFDPRGDPATVLGDITRRANTAFFEGIPPETWARRRAIAWAVAGALGLALLAAAAWTLPRRRRSLQLRALAATPAAPGLTRRGRTEILAWLLLLPAVASIALWAYYPLLKGAVLAFLDYRILGDSTAVGLDNFIEVFTQRTFWVALLQTGVYAALALGLGFAAPIFLALLLSEVPRGTYLFRTVFYLPAVTSGLVVMVLWMLMYDASPHGVLNRALAWLTADPTGRAFTITSAGVALAVLALLVVTIVDGVYTARDERRRWRAGLFALLAAPLLVDLAAALVPGAPRVVDADLLHAGDRQVVHLTLIAGARLLALALAGAAAYECVRYGDTRAAAWVRRGLLVLGALAAASFAATVSTQLVPMDRPYAWLQDPAGYWAMLWVIVPGVWAGVGPGCIIYLAAIKSIPDELYEAADLDGAGVAHKAWHVTIQFLRPLILINFLGAFVGTCHAMGNILVMTGGGPGTKTMTLGMDIFFNAFTHLRFGYATAEAWVLGSLLIGFTVYQLRVLKQLRFTRAAS